jgi:hypothetical protein
VEISKCPGIARDVCGDWLIVSRDHISGECEPADVSVTGEKEKTNRETFR